MNNPQPWWRNTTIYQIYPRSFQDSNQDGIGDLAGIISRLDYLKDLGFETLWISPFFTSPQKDFGYDISDYLEVDPQYGHLADVQQLIEEAHQKQMRVLLDLVLNHTSDQHPWFQESRTSKDNSKRDWYIWQDGRGKGPPNNWRSIIGGSGWHHDQPTDQWYYASFLPFQPDLNYRNPEVIQAMLAIARHWLDLGVDGYRLDIFSSLFKDAAFRDNPWSTTLFSRDFQSGYFQKWKYNLNQPETIQFACQLRELADSYPTPRLLLGEVYADHQTLKSYLGPDARGLNLVFQWDLLDLRPQADFFRELIRKFEASFGVPHTPLIAFGSHDHQRLLTRIGGDRRLAALLAVFQFTARGVPVTYYGEEIGMCETCLPREQWLDPVGKRFSWLPKFVQNAMRLSVTRDGCRTPMQWNTDPNAGFTPLRIEPWLPLNENAARVNVANQSQDPGSLLNTYRGLLHLRKTHPPLHQGSLALLDAEPNCPDLLAYRRTADEETLLVLINFGHASCSFNLAASQADPIFTIGGFQPLQKGGFHLEPQSAVILAN